jgi:hypothetical protein
MTGQKVWDIDKCPRCNGALVIVRWDFIRNSKGRIAQWQDNPACLKCKVIFTEIELPGPRDYLILERLK